MLCGCHAPMTKWLTGHGTISRQRVLSQTKEPVYKPREMQSYPQQTPVFVQGLVLSHNDLLFTSSGGWGNSFLRSVDLNTSLLNAKIDIRDHDFSEGITILNHRLYQLFWKSGRGIVYSIPQLQPLTTFKFKGEGWGLTNDGRDLIMSNGSAKLLFLDPSHPETVKKELVVHSVLGPVDNLNALSYSHGIIYANVWHLPMIVLINAKNGEVLGWIDAYKFQAPFAHRLSRQCAVLNGITHMPNQKRQLIITGKCWDKLYRIAY
jgi:glutaminyl-peptide cyclotransferase